MDMKWMEVMDMELQRIAGARIRLLGALDFSKFSPQWILLIVGVVTLVVGAVLSESRRKKIANLPPGPRNWPIIGALPSMEPLFHQALGKFAAKYGPVVFFRLGVQNLVVLSSAEAAEELLKHRDAEFADREAPMIKSVTKLLCYEGAVLTFANYDALYKMHRKMSVTEFFTAAKIKSYENLRTQELAVMVEKIFSAIDQSNNNSNDANDRNHASHGPTSPVVIHSTAFAMIQNIIFSLSIGKRFDSLPPSDELTEFPDIMLNLRNLILSFNLADFVPWLAWLDPQGLLKRMKDHQKRQTQWYEMVLKRAKQEMRRQRDTGIVNEADKESTNNFAHVLLHAQETGTNITDIGIIGTIFSIVSGGIDTTSTQIEWALLEVVRHPKVLQRLQHELDQVLGKERPLEEADLQEMPFLNAVILESVRLHGIVAHTFPHVNMKPSTLCGYNIPAKTGVMVNIYSISRDPKVWKHPHQFDPDRFMASVPSADPTLSPETIKANGSNYHLLPFGSGRRSCVGYNLAILLLTRTIGTLFHAFDWSPPPGSSLEDLSIEEEGGVTLHPKFGVQLVPTPRLSSQVYKTKFS